MTDTDGNGSVRITNADIYREVRALSTAVTGLGQTMNDVVRPKLDRHDVQIDALKESKADKTETAKLDGAISSVRVQTYAIVSGVIAALVMLKTIGVI